MDVGVKEKAGRRRGARARRARARTRPTRGVADHGAQAAWPGRRGRAGARRTIDPPRGEN